MEGKAIVILVNWLNELIKLIELIEWAVDRFNFKKEFGNRPEISIFAISSEGVLRTKR
jgi:hypothetical protein